MTNKEAITILENLKIQGNTIFSQRFAIDLAIKALNCQESLEKKIEFLMNERPQGEWIPVSESLPNLYEVVLVTDETGTVFEYERRPLDEEGNVCEEWSFLGRNITAWMPLPEAYKEGGAE